MGKIVSLISTGNDEIAGIAQKMPAGEYTAGELLLAENSAAAIEKIRSDTTATTEGRITHIGLQFISNYPTRANAAVSFLSAFVRKYPNSVDIQQLIGLASLLAQDRTRAKEAFKKAFALDSTQTLTRSAMRILDPENAPAAPKDSWKVPFALNELFQDPTTQEVAAVRQDWLERDLSASVFEVIDQFSVNLDGCKYDLRIIRHDVQGLMQYSALFVPQGAKSGSSPVVLELYGVDSRYSPFELMS